MAGVPIAEVFVTVRPDLTGFRAKLDAEIKRATAGASGTATVKVNVDGESITGTVREIQQRFERSLPQVTRTLSGGMFRQLPTEGRRAAEQLAAQFRATVHDPSKISGPIGQAISRGIKDADVLPAIRNMQANFERGIGRASFKLPEFGAEVRGVGQFGNAVRDMGENFTEAEQEVNRFQAAVRRLMASGGGGGGGGGVRGALGITDPNRILRAIPSIGPIVNRLYAAAVLATPAVFALGSSLAYASTSAVAIAPAMLGATAAIGTLVGALAGPLNTFRKFIRDQDTLEQTTISNAAALRSATDTLTDARKAATRGAQDSAERIADAQRTEVQAQRDLNEARAEAVRNLEDLRDRTLDLALDEESAQLRIERAQQRITEAAQSTSVDTTRAYQEALNLLDRAQSNVADALAKSGANSAAYRTALGDLASAQDSYNRISAQGGSGLLDYREALLDLKQAQQGLSEIQRQRTRTQTDLATAEAKGVSGADGVVAAQQRVSDAHAATVKAQQQAAQSQEDAAIAVARATLALQDVQSTQAAKARQDTKTNTAEAAAFLAQLKRARLAVLELQKTSERTTLPGFTNALAATTELFPIVNEGMAKFGEAMSDAGDDSARLMRTPFFRAQFKSILDGQARAFKTLTALADPLLRTLMTLGEAASPLVERFATFVAQQVNLFAAFIESKRRSGELADFFRDAGDKLAVWGQVVGRFIMGLINVMGSARDSGDQLATRMSNLGATFQSWSASERARQSVTNFFDFFARIDYQKIGEVAVAAGKLYLTYAAFRLAGTFARSPFWWLVGTAITRDPALASAAIDAFWRATKPMADFLIAHPNAFATLITLIGAFKIAAAAGAAVPVIAAIAGIFGGGGIKRVLLDFATGKAGVMNVNAGVVNVNGAAGVAGGAAGRVGRVAGRIGGALALAAGRIAPPALVGYLTIADPLGVFDRPKQWVKDFGGFVAGMGRSFGSLLSGSNSNVEGEFNADPTGIAARHRAERAAKASDTFFTNARRASAAGTEFQRAINGINDAVDVNGKTLAASTTQGKANRQVILDAAKAAIAHGEAIKTVTGDTKAGLRTRDADLTQLRQQATQYGLNKGEVDKLIQSVLDMPANKEAKLRADMTDAQHKVDLTNKLLADPNLTKERRAQLTATKTKLETTLAAAKRDLADFQHTQWATDVMMRIQPQIRDASGRVVSLGVVAGNRIRAEAAGGPISGPGTGTSDEIPAWVSNGEWVIRARSAAGIGSRAMTVINNADLLGSRFVPTLLSTLPAGGPRLATGGPVLGRGYGPVTAAPAAAPTVYVAPPVVRVYIGQQEITSAVRIVVSERENQVATALRAGRGGYA